MGTPAGLTPTRRSLHAVGEHVLAAARYRATGRIGLVPKPGGFGTPAFRGRVLRVDGLDLVVEDAEAVRRAPLTTVAAAAAFAGVEPGMPDTVYQPATRLAPDEVLTLDPDAAASLAAWLAVGAEALGRFADEVADDHPTAATLWPEHFDLALSAAEVNYGISLGDDVIGEPYAYVGPWARPLPGDPAFWDQAFGATRTRRRVVDVAGLASFFRAGRRAARPR